MKYLLPLFAAMFVIGCADSYDKPKPAPIPKETPGRYRSEGGDFPVGAIPNGTLHDAQRNKDLDLVIEYPSRGQGPFPVIVFSHGYGASNRSYVGLTEYWAGHGYVCIKPSHADAGKLRELLRERRADRTLGEAIWESQGVAEWRDRVRDVTFILDSFNALEERYPELKGKLDRNRIAVGGHSYGAFVAMLLAGVEPVRDGKAVQLGDPRVKAIVAMSPQGVSSLRGLTAESFRNVKVPAMFMTGSEDRGAVESETPEWRRGAFDNAPPGDKYFVLINGAGHMSFGGGFTLPSAEDDSFDRMDELNGQRDPQRAAPRTRGENRFIQQRAIFDTIKIAAAAFWDAYLKDAPAAREYLDTKLDSRGGVTLIKK
jgi:predicted dienelactone hydrolase